MTTPNEAADRLRRTLDVISERTTIQPRDRAGISASIRAYGDARAATERQRTVDEIRAEVGLDGGWEFRRPGVEQINPYDLHAILDSVAGREADR